jgi:hypothetical protein
MTTTTQPTHATPPPPARRRSAGRTAALVGGTVLLVGGTVAAAGGAALLVVDDSWRDAGYLTSDSARVSTSSHALATEGIELGGFDEDWVLGRARVRVTERDPAADVFVGVARAADAEAFLSGVGHATVTEIDDPATTYRQHAGAAPTTDPADSPIWVAQSHGTGRQSIDWRLDDRADRWTVVVMHADGSADVDVDADIGATVPVLPGIGWAFVASGAMFALGGGGLLAGARRQEAGDGSTTTAPPSAEEPA